MAMVYLASDLRLERRVAVKVMHAHLADEENFVRRFEREALSAARLAHPNVVNVLDQGTADGRAYLVMEYLPGITLRDLLKQQRRLTPDQATEIAEAVLAGLAAAHRADIVHRDLKPENVLLADDGRIKIGDFGLARAVSANTTTGQALLGTIAYLSPELVTRGIADARSDVYAFGIMMFEMLTGAQPFTGEQPMQIAYQHAHSDVPAPSSRARGISPELDELVRWTTQRDPDARPRDAGMVLDHLTTLRAGSMQQATRVLPTDEFASGATPATTVLDEAQRDALAAPPPTSFEEPDSAASEASEPRAPIGAARDAASQRKRRGKISAIVIVVLALLAGGAAWWIFQGPGARVTVPDVAGLSMDDAHASLSDLDLEAEDFSCTSVDVPVGSAVRTEPEAGTRVDRGGVVKVCASAGPEMLPVPTLVGLTADDAEHAIEDAGFSVGDVADKRFTDADAGTVIAALDADGEELGDEYAEQGRVDLILSMGPIPDVSGLSVQAATDALTEQELTVDPGLAEESHHDQVEKGQVIGLVVNTDPLRAGDSVGLRVSLGPELFPIPDISDRPLQDAMDALAAEGFEPTTAVPSALRGFAKATGTDPAAGEQVRKGATVQVRATIDL